MAQEPQCVAEISLYPLQSDFIPVIKRFIDTLQAYPEFTLHVTTTSTQVMGPYSLLFRVLGDEIARVHKESGQAILACKFLKGDGMSLGAHSDHSTTDSER